MLISLFSLARRPGSQHDRPHISPLAGKLLDPADLIRPADLIDAYYSGVPDPSQPSQRIHFGTSGHRGSAFRNSFNEPHIVAIAQSICLYRKRQGIDGPLFLGIDTHALSRPAFVTALEVFVANDVVTMIDAGDGYTPTPVISHAILAYNRGRTEGLADGVVLTPSHNPPEDGGFKYNPPTGGPANSTVTGWIEDDSEPTARNRGSATCAASPMSARGFRPAFAAMIIWAIMSATSPA